MTTAYDVIVAFAGVPSNDLEHFIAYFAALLIGVIFDFLILWVIIRIMFSFKEGS